MPQFLKRLLVLLGFAVMASPAYALITSGLDFPLWLALWLFFPYVWLGILPFNLVFLAMCWPKRDKKPGMFYGLLCFAVLGSIFALVSWFAT